MLKRTLAKSGSLILLVALVAACSRSPGPAPVSAPVGNPGQAPVAQQDSPAGVYGPRPAPAPAPVVGKAAALLPAGDTPLVFRVRDQGASDSTAVQEYLLREGDRAVAVAGERAYAVWEIRPDGVWRVDPRNPTALLRYLPASLSDGLVWSQASGSADVWFRLSLVADCGQLAPTCWDLITLNRGERTVFRFAPSKGPVAATADNWTEPARSFQKSLDPESRPAAPLSAQERQRLLKGLAASPQPAPVREATREEFAAAVFRSLQAAQPTLQTIQLDLNGDGRLDVVQGRLSEWTAVPLRFFQDDGAPAGYPLTPGTGKMRVTRLPFPGMRLPAFLIERPDDNGFAGVTIVTARENPYMKTWAMEQVYGWGSKAQGTRADRVSWTADGKITVEWDLKDPARHTRVTEYTWYEDAQQKWSGVRRVSVSYRPEAGELRYPATLNDLLQAAFVARWLGLADELPRYFATPAVAAAFAAAEWVSKPDYGPGAVQIGALTPPGEVTQSCGPQVAAVDPQGPGPHTFAAFWNGYEWCSSVWGRVTFGVDAQGRPVISNLTLEGASGAAH